MKILMFALTLLRQVASSPRQAASLLPGPRKIGGSTLKYGVIFVLFVTAVSPYIDWEKVDTDLTHAELWLADQQDEIDFARNWTADQIEGLADLVRAMGDSMTGGASETDTDSSQLAQSS